MRDLVSRAKPRASSPPTSPADAPDPYDPNCPTRVLLDRIGDKWTVLVLGLLRRGPLRFNELRRAVGGVTQKMLSQTLKGLERDGLVARKALPTAPVTVEYSLTPLGVTLTSTIERLQRWAREHIEDVERAQKRYDAARAPRFATIRGRRRAPGAATRPVAIIPLDQ